MIARAEKQGNTEQLSFLDAGMLGIVAVALLDLLGAALTGLSLELFRLLALVCHIGTSLFISNSVNTYMLYAQNSTGNKRVQGVNSQLGKWTTEFLRWRGQMVYNWRGGI